MAIFLDENSRVIVQGMTGSEGQKHTRRMLSAGTNVVAVAVTTGDTTVMKWDALTGMIDLSGYMRKTDLTPASDAEIDALFA